ncbi:MAG: thioredoxin-disulfide reductase [Clostridium sp.]|nr:thioredoxin-disulfide reductase [Clostridium sp.]
MQIHDLIIIGSGPAGLSAVIYAMRAQLDTLVIEKNMMSGGQILNTYEVDNYPGLPGISGFDLGQKLREHADRLEAVFVEDTVIRTELKGKIKKVIGENGTYEAKTVIIASGAHHRTLGVAGEALLTGAGVSYCATCDGAFFRGKTVAVVGGGDVALEDAIFLARMCEKVYVIHRRDELRGAKSLQTKLFSLENVEVIWDTVVEEITGSVKVESLKLLNKKTQEHTELEVDGVFIAVGIEPDSGAYAGEVALDGQGYVIAGEDGCTSESGVFAAGDIRTKLLRQVITAAADGAVCVTSAERYLAEK